MTIVHWFIRAHRRCLLLFAALAALFAGACGAPTAKNPTTVPASSTASTAKGSPIRIGELADITGTFALNGAAMHIATDLAVQQINAAGGINGHPLDVDYADPKGDPAEAVQLATQLVQQDHVDVLIGAVSSAECLGVEQLAPKLGIIYVPQAGCANEELTSKSCNEYTFRIFPTGRQLIEPLTGYLIKTFGKRWAILYPDYAFGQSQLAAYQSGLEKAGGSITVKIPVPLNETNVSPYISKIPTDGSTDGVIATFSGADQSRVAGVIQQFGINKKLPIVGAGTKEHFGGVYPDALNGAIDSAQVLSGAPSGNTFAQTFDQQFKDQAAKQPSLADALGGVSRAVAGQSGYQAYTAVTALKEAMTASKFTGKADTEKLVSSMENLNAPLGPDFSYGPLVMNKADHQGRSTVYVYKVDGQAEDILAQIPPDKVPPIGDCHV